MSKKKISIFSKLLYAINSIFATVLLLSYLLPYISPKSLPTLAVLSLFVPFLILINIAFFIYWLIKLKKHFILSGLILAIGWLTEFLSEVFSSDFLALFYFEQQLAEPTKITLAQTK